MNRLVELFGSGDAHRGVTQSLDLRSLFAFATASKHFSTLLGKFACGQVWVVSKPANEQTGNPVLCYDVHQDVWESCPALPVACEFASIVEVDNDIYVLGWSSDRLGAVFVAFDRRRKVWDDLGELPLALRTYRGTDIAVLDGRIYIMGELDSADEAGDPFGHPVRIAAYSRAGSWEFVPPWPSLSFDSSMLALDGLLYLVGACDVQVYFEHYNPVIGRWTDLGHSVFPVEEQLRPVLEEVGLSRKSERHVVAFGKGILASHVKINTASDFSVSPTSLFQYITHDFWFYSFESGEWSRQDPMPTPRQSDSLCLSVKGRTHHNRTALSADMYYTFGCRGAEGRVEGYCNTTGTWNIYKSSHFGRHYKYVLTTNGNRLIAIGGYHATDEDDESSSEDFSEEVEGVEDTDEDGPTASPIEICGSGRRRKTKRCYEECRNHVEMFIPRPGGINPGGIWKLRSPLPDIRGRDIIAASACGIYPT